VQGVAGGGGVLQEGEEAAEAEAADQEGAARVGAQELAGLADGVVAVDVGDEG